jgi:hypothetical protein
LKSANKELSLKLTKISSKHASDGLNDRDELKIEEKIENVTFGHNINAEESDTNHFTSEERERMLNMINQYKKQITKHNGEIENQKLEINGYSKAKVKLLAELTSIR